MSRMNMFNLNNGGVGTQMLNQIPHQTSKANYLTQFIDKKCTCEFFINSDIVKKTGLLDSVGTDFIVLTSINNPDERLICPLDELKFIKFY